MAGNSVFFSWQSDTRAAANRTLIQDALEGAVRELRADGGLAVEPVIERDTAGLPGAPDIGLAIFGKIDASVGVVADVTIVGSLGDRPSPNPNVLVELGYALKSLGWQRIIMVQNVAFGGPEVLPFDLRQKRVLTYDSAPDASERATERRRLQGALKDALAAIFRDAEAQAAPEFPAKLVFNRKDLRIVSERHDYSLEVFLENTGARAIGDWHVDVTLPTRLLEPGTVFALRVPERSNAQTTLFRSTADKFKSPLYPGDSRLVLSVEYFIDSRLFWDQQELFDESITAVAYVDGEQGPTTSVPVRTMQNF